MEWIINLGFYVGMGFDMNLTGSTKASLKAKFPPAKLSY